MPDARLPILVYSHLRWDSVFQRPQQIVSRLAQRRRVLFIEEPLLHDTRKAPSWEIATPLAGLQVCRPITEDTTSVGFAPAQIPGLIGMTSALVREQRIEKHIAWLYSPMAVRLARALDPVAIVYDCMDELSSFMHAPSELPELEAELLEHADLAFMGGPSLYRAKRHRNPNVYCFPSSVDAAHFGKACNGAPDHEEQRDLERPRLGFFGVLDERLDTDLIRHVATARPECQIVLVGPVAKISADTLPRGANIHYMGGRPYAELPRFLSGWDVCLLPFALNDATRYISPTKTLEYMAAQRPIVSTAITDVVDPYSDVVSIAHTPDQFIAACERALTEGTRERSANLQRMREVLARTSWDETVRSMERLLFAEPRPRSLVEARPVRRRPSTRRVRQQDALTGSTR